MKYRKKPIVIEAMQLPPEDEDCTEEFMQYIGECDNITSGRNGEMEIETLEGDMVASPGDWIIKGIKGELYPCKDDIFKLTYEPVDEAKS